KEQLLQNFSSVKDIEINLDIKVEELELLKPVNWQ
ncbi:aldo/keto reductase, partial [Bacteroides fragilis]